MRVIIAGSRSVTDDIDYVEMSVAESGFEVTEIVSGCATGIDQKGIDWAKKHSIHVEKFPANWDDLSHPDAIIKINLWGKQYDARAGLRRNVLMSVRD